MQKDISGVIKRAFQDFNTLVARANGRASDTDDKTVVSAWKYMERVAMHPDVYFCPEYTQDEWDNRIIALTTQVDVINVQTEDIRWFIRTPAMILCENVKPAFKNQLKLYEQYWSFCESVLKYEYGHGWENGVTSPYDNVLRVAQNVHWRVTRMQLRDKVASMLKKRECEH